MTFTERFVKRYLADRGVDAAAGRKVALGAGKALASMPDSHASRGSRWLVHIAGLLGKLNVERRIATVTRQ